MFETCQNSSATTSKRFVWKRGGTTAPWREHQEFSRIRVVLAEEWMNVKMVKKIKLEPRPTLQHDKDLNHTPKST